MLFKNDIMNKAAIIQVRMDSSRFPGKATQLIEGKPILFHVIERSKLIGIPVIVATTTRKVDDPIEEISKKCGVKCFRGAFEDVLDRYYQAAKQNSIDVIFRITADCPLIDPKLCKKLVNVFEDNPQVDYARFVNYPIGVGMEGCTFSALENAWQNAKLHEEREHVTVYLKIPSKNFHIVELSPSNELGEHYWAVEEPNDLSFVSKIFSFFKNKKIFYTEDILLLLNTNSKFRK
jgi:spore coat polysaccharide biosynthesis protein SpsF